MYIYHAWQRVAILATGCKGSKNDAEMQKMKGKRTQKIAPKYWLSSFRFFSRYDIHTYILVYVISFFLEREIG